MASSMSEKDLFFYLDAMFAGEQGCGDGVDPLTTHKVRECLREKPVGARMRLLHQFLLVKYPPESGYRIEDWVEFLQFLEWFMVTTVERRADGE